ncbi:MULTISPECIES: L-threonylcarbamoyladenylate synthase [unclassified Schaalia]|uniref:L-threonylcarbamoyladenylate synthase n=1 Tax=unclassified Schaalia TaxID=2691889 RepID=UPI001E52DF97|nr:MULTISPECIES: L-threonylcarbamoyladenylate synthase [unclassified Schaalia]MCD4550184.1 threonylcarbamoyl-AMP synthase [Schaalia sp. lx-260]MCD4557396.1 threonylcarbamoyl-AMP synthase [Schaalia sp. lx-100]
MSYVEMHPVNPQTRFISQTVEILKNSGTIALPTDSGYAIACALGNKSGMDLIRQIRRLDDKHNFSLLCHSFAQIGELVILDNSEFRTIKALTPGPYTFIVRGTKEVPRMTLNKKKHTVGIRLPEHVITQEILRAYGAPLVSSTLIMPEETEPLCDGYEVEDRIGHQVDLVISAPVGSSEPTTVVDFTSGSVEIVRVGAGDISLFS